MFSSFFFIVIVPFHYSLPISLQGDGGRNGFHGLWPPISLGAFPPFSLRGSGRGLWFFVIEGFHFSLPFFPTRRLGTGAWFSLLKALTSSHPSSLRGDWGGALLLVCPYLLPSLLGGDWGLQSSHQYGCGPTKGSESPFFLRYCYESGKAERATGELGVGSFFLRESGRGFIGGEGSKNSALLQDFTPGKSFAFENIN